jgi:small subunit ribosomal protein S7
MKDDAKSGHAPAKPSTRTFSTLARRQMEVTPGSDASSLDASMMPSAAQQVSTA